MIIDSTKADIDFELAASVVICGAGAAGITMACELEDLGIDVLLVESGGFEFDDEVQSLYEGYVDTAPNNSLPHEPLDIYRMRQFGGTTEAWGGACLPYDTIDFTAKPNIFQSGWPLNRSDIDQYYRKANNYLNLGNVDFDLIPKGKNGSREIINGISVSGIFKTKYWAKAEPKVSFGQKYRDRLKKSKSVRVLLNCNVVEISLDDDKSRVSSVKCTTLSGNNTIIKGKVFVLSMGGLETPRLMLTSSGRFGAGVGNAQDLVGRYFSSHVNLTHGILVLKTEVGIDKDYQSLSDKLAYRKFLSVTDSYISNGLMNCKLTLEPLSSVEKNRLTDHVYKLFNPNWDVSEIYEGLRGRKKHAFALNGAFDQTPNPQSRVRLSKEKDALGIPKLILNHQIMNQDQEAYSKTFDLLAKAVGIAGIGRFCYDETLKDLFLQGGGASHHTGTTRMASSKKNGVVDTNCKVFGVGNLYIASASVFSSPSHANPTYTIVALTIRLAEHISEQLGKKT